MLIVCQRHWLVVALCLNKSGLACCSLCIPLSCHNQQSTKLICCVKSSTYSHAEAVVVVLPRCCSAAKRASSKYAWKFACKTQNKMDHRKAVLKLDVDMLHCVSKYRFGAASSAVALDCDTNKIACLHCRSSEGQPQHCASSLALLMIKHHRRRLAAAASLTCRLRQLRLFRSVRKTLLQLCHPPMQMLRRLLVLQTQRCVISASSM